MTDVLGQLSDNVNYPLFVYGQLLDRRRGLQASVRGLLRIRDRGGDVPDAAARFGAQYQTRVYGQVRWFSAEEIRGLVREEAPEYSIVRVTLDDGRRVFAFEDVEPGWENEPFKVGGSYFD
jgi:hypothetical protein